MSDITIGTNDKADRDFIASNLKKANEELKQAEEEKQNILNENDKLKKLLQNYNDSRKNYYEKNKEIIKAKAKQGLKKLSDENPEKLKEYRRNAYLRQKEKSN